MNNKDDDFCDKDCHMVSMAVVKEDVVVGCCNNASCMTDCVLGVGRVVVAGAEVVVLLCTTIGVIASSWSSDPTVRVVAVVAAVAAVAVFPLWLLGVLVPVVTVSAAPTGMIGDVGVG
jgi:hypothetical protein